MKSMLQSQPISLLQYRCSKYCQSEIQHQELPHQPIQEYWQFNQQEYYIPEQAQPFHYEVQPQELHQHHLQAQPYHYDGQQAQEEKVKKDTVLQTDLINTLNNMQQVSKYNFRSPALGFMMTFGCNDMQPNKCNGCQKYFDEAPKRKITRCPGCNLRIHLTCLRYGCNNCIKT